MQGDGLESTRPRSRTFAKTVGKRKSLFPLRWLRMNVSLERLAAICSLQGDDLPGDGAHTANREPAERGPRCLRPTPSNLRLDFLTHASPAAFLSFQGLP